MHAALVEDGLIAGRPGIAWLMRDNGLEARRKRRFKKTTGGGHGGPAASNIAIVLGLYSRRIVGWAVGD